LADSGELTEKQSTETAAEAAARAAWLAAEAAQLAMRAAHAARFAEKITRVVSAVAREFGLRPIVDCVLDETIRILEARFVILHLTVDNRALKLVGQRALPEDLTEKISCLSFDDALLTAQCASSGRLQIVSSIDELDRNLKIDYQVLSCTGCNTIVALPLLARNRLLGVLTFALTGPHEFVTEERAALASCAEVFSIGIDHAAMYEEERRLHALFEAISQAAVAIAGELALLPSLQGISDRAREVLDAEYAALGIVESEGQPFDPWVFSGMTKEQADSVGRVPRAIGTLGIVASGHTVRVVDVCQHSSFCGLPNHHPPIRGFLGVPIHHNGKPVGNLYIANKRSAAEFSPEDQRAIELLAAHAGAAVHQSHLREQLNIERTRFKTIVEYAPHGVIFIETKTMKVLANRRAVELIGRPLPTDAPEWVGYENEFFTPDGRLVPEEDRPIRRAMRGEAVPTQELIIRRPNGSNVPVLVSASPVLQIGTIEGVVLVFENISVLKELQQCREEWAALITHDLRQPLNILMMQIQILQGMAGSSDPERLYNAAEQMKNTVRSLNRMVGDLTDVSQIETKRLTLQRHLVDLESLIRGVVERQQALAPERRLEFHVAGPIPEVYIDALRMEKVLVNLITNALKYSDAGSTVDIDVRIVDDDVHVLVTNRGQGISPEELPRLFDRYYRTPRAQGRASGLGLGLYIARSLIEAHGGHIWAESTPGQTTTFHFVLPLVNH
jgi:PAS domain S-box-containing protein